MSDRTPDRIVTMPPCPSTNALWVRVPGKPRVRSEAYREWAARAGWEVRRQLLGVEAIDCRFDVVIHAPISRRDTDNWAKATLDLCESVGVVTNDGNAHVVTIIPENRNDILVAIYERRDIGGVRKPAAPRSRGAARRESATRNTSAPLNSMSLATYRKLNARGIY